MGATATNKRDHCKKAVGEGWEDKLACMIMKASPESYFSVDMDVKGEDELSFSVASQAGMLSQKVLPTIGEFCAFFSRKEGVSVLKLSEICRWGLAIDSGSIRETTLTICVI